MYKLAIAVSIVLVAVAVKDLLQSQRASDAINNDQNAHTVKKRGSIRFGNAFRLLRFVRFVRISRPPKLIPKLSQHNAMTKVLFDIMTDEMIGPWIELGFHACVGGCDGCVNLNLKPNKALTETVNGLLSLHEPFKNVVSYADFVTLSVVVAADEAIKRGGGTVGVGMRYGRKTCTKPLTNNKVQDLPGGDDPDAAEATRNMMGLSVRETTALLGAHSVGKCHRSHQGYEGQWDFTPVKLDNAYFQSLLNSDWAAVTAPDVQKVQWIPNKEKHLNLKTVSPSRMMLHSDIGLKIDFSRIGKTNNPTCTALKGGTETQTAPCNKSSKFLPWVKLYAANNVIFQKDFAKVLQKVLEHKNSALKPAIIDVTKG